MPRNRKCYGMHDILIIKLKLYTNFLNKINNRIKYPDILDIKIIY